MNEDFVAHCLELLDCLDAVRSRRLFGGHGFYVDDLCVALLTRDRRLYCRVDDLTQAQFSQAGCRRFEIQRNGVTKHLPYWTVPEEALESPPQMQPWARLALAAALRARAAKAPRQRRHAAGKASKPARGSPAQRRP